MKCLLNNTEPNAFGLMLVTVSGIWNDELSEKSQPTNAPIEIVLTDEGIVNESGMYSGFHKLCDSGFDVQTFGMFVG